MDRRWIRSIGLENVSFAFSEQPFPSRSRHRPCTQRRFEARKVSHFLSEVFRELLSLSKSQSTVRLSVSMFVFSVKWKPKNGSRQALEMQLYWFLCFTKVLHKEITFSRYSTGGLLQSHPKSIHLFHGFSNASRSIDIGQVRLYHKVSDIRRLQSLLFEHLRHGLKQFRPHIPRLGPRPFIHSRIIFQKNKF